MTNLKKKYIESVIPKIMKEFNLKNIHQAPKLEKVVINVGIGKLRADKKMIDIIKSDISAITGQKPVIRRAKKSIAGFKIKQGDIAGISVTLRKDKMYDFVDKFINITLPRIRDFRGLDEKSFDGDGNYSIGLSEQIVFPEIKYEKVDKIYSLEICLTISANNKKMAHSLLQNLGFPFKKIHSHTK